jgi:hypothetical protein
MRSDKLGSLPLSPFPFAAVFVVLSAPVFAEPPSAWTLDRIADGMRVDLRAVPGSDFQEVRVTTQSPLPLRALCDAVWGKNAKVSGDFLKRVIISETDSDRWTYEQVKVPFVTNRDMVMHVKLDDAVDQGRCEVDFQTGEHKDWPAAKNFVRLRAVRGHWTLKQQHDGTTAITYLIYSDPGGAVPAFLARGGQRDAAVSFMKTILARAQAK